MQRAHPLLPPITRPLQSITLCPVASSCISIRNMGVYIFYYEINSTPFFVNAVSFMPTGIASSAEMSAMCSLPLPDARESATSKSSFR